MVADLQPPLDCKKIALLGLCPTYNYVLRILAQSFGLSCSCKSGSYRSVGQFFYKSYWFDGRDQDLLFSDFYIFSVGCFVAEFFVESDRSFVELPNTQLNLSQAFTQKPLNL